MEEAEEIPKSDHEGVLANRVRACGRKRKACIVESSSSESESSDRHVMEGEAQLGEPAHEGVVTVLQGDERIADRILARKNRPR